MHRLFSIPFGDMLALSDTLATLSHFVQFQGFTPIYNKRRPPIERKIAELIYHGLRKTRYRGVRKSRLQALFTASAVNFKKILKEQENKKINLDIPEAIPAFT